MKLVTAQRVPRRGAVSMMSVLAIAAAIVIVALSWQLHRARGFERQVDQIRLYPHAGQWEPTIQVATLSGDSVTLGETQSGRAQVLIAFSTTCPFCLATLSKWKAMADSLNRDPQARFDVVWISASSWDSTRAYVATHDIQGIVGRFPTAKMAKVYQFKTVPLTVVLDHYGRVAHMHASVFANQAAMDSIYIAAYRAVAADTTAVATAASPQSVRR